MARKTFDNIVKLKEIVNRRNQHSTCDAKNRAGWNSILEEVLHNTDNYKGFAFLTPDKVPLGHMPGILKDCGEYPLGLGETNSDQFKGCDESRRFYY